jgi:hypothetical protein
MMSALASAATAVTARATGAWGPVKKLPLAEREVLRKCGDVLHTVSQLKQGTSTMSTYPAPCLCWG